MGDVAEDDLVEGDRYEVSWADCCSKGSFTATLVELRRCTDVAVTHVDYGSLEELRFDNGVTLAALGYGTRFVPVDPS